MAQKFKLFCLIRNKCKNETFLNDFQTLWKVLPFLYFPKKLFYHLLDVNWVPEPYFDVDCHCLWPGYLYIFQLWTTTFWKIWQLRSLKKEWWWYKHLKFSSRQLWQVRKFLKTSSWFRPFPSKISPELLSDMYLESWFTFCIFRHKGTKLWPLLLDTYPSFPKMSLFG